MLKKEKKFYINKAQEIFLKKKMSLLKLFKWIITVPTESDVAFFPKKINTENTKKPINQLSFYLSLAFFAVIILSFLLPQITYAGGDIVNNTSVSWIESLKSSAGNFFANKAAKALNWAGVTVLAPISMVILGLLSGLLTIAGLLFDYVVDYTITDLSLNITSFKVGIDQAWGILRDLANMLFIFVLLYISIATILQLSSVDTKRMLKNVVIVALLINFSMFFTEIVIDVTNTFATTFNGAIRSTVVSHDTDYQATGKTVDEVSISQAFMNSTDLISTWFDDTANTAALKQASNGEVVPLLMLTFVLGAFIIVLSFVLLAGAFFLIVRFVMFMLLIILSPLAFVSAITPQTSGLFSRWFKHLTNNALFAPVFMALLWVSIVLLQTTSPVPPGASSATPFEAGASGDIIMRDSSEAIFQAILAIGFVFASLLIAKSLSIHGATKAPQLISKWGRRGAYKSGAFVANQTAGRIAARRADNKELKERAAKGSAWAKMQLYAGDKVANMGKKGGYKGSEQRRTEKIKKRADLYKTSNREKDKVKTSLEQAKATLKQAQASNDPNKITAAENQVSKARQERDQVMGVNKQELARREALAKKAVDREIVKIHQERKRKGIDEMTRGEEQVARAKRLERTKKAMQQKEGYAMEETLSEEQKLRSDYVKSIKDNIRHNNANVREALKDLKKEETNS